MGDRERGAASSAMGYAVAIALSAAAFCSWRLTGWTQLPVIAVHFVFAIIPCTWYFGWRVGLLATVLALFSIAAGLPPAPSLAVDSANLPRLIAFAFIACFLLWIISAARSSSRSLRHALDDLNAKHEALIKSQDLLHMVLSTLPVGVSVTDTAGNIVLNNDMSEQIWGGKYPVSGTERWAISRGYWHGSGKAITPEQWASARALARGEVTRNELIDIEAYDGSRKTLQNFVTPIHDSNGQIIGAVVVNEDVTERIRAEEALQTNAHRLQRLSRRMFAVQEDERRNLSRELHDEFGQLIATASVQLRAAINLGGASARDLLDECVALLQRAGTQVRSLALDLRPIGLEAGLDTALRSLAAQQEQRTGLVTSVSGHVSYASGAVAIACYRVAQEALTNVVRHARAQHAWIELVETADALQMTIRDDGIGFDVKMTTEHGNGRLGLLGMRERLEILEGMLDIDSGPGRGTRIRVSVRKESGTGVGLSA